MLEEFSSMEAHFLRSRSNLPKESEHERRRTVGGTSNSRCGSASA